MVNVGTQVSIRTSGLLVFSSLSSWDSSRELCRKSFSCAFLRQARVDHEITRKLGVLSLVCESSSRMAGRTAQ